MTGVQSIDYAAIGPPLLLAVVAIAVLVLDAFLPARRRILTAGWLSLGGLVAAAALLLPLVGDEPLDREPSMRVPDRRLKGRVEPELAETVHQHRPTGDRAGHRDRPRAFGRHRVVARPSQRVHRHSLRRGPRRVEAEGLGVRRPVLREEVAPYTG